MVSEMVKAVRCVINDLFTYSCREQCKELSWLGREIQSNSLLAEFQTLTQIFGIPIQPTAKLRGSEKWSQLWGTDPLYQLLRRISDHEIQTRTINRNLVWSWYRSYSNPFISATVSQWRQAGGELGKIEYQWLIPMDPWILLLLLSVH